MATKDPIGKQSDNFDKSMSSNYKVNDNLRSKNGVTCSSTCRIMSQQAEMEKTDAELWPLGKRASRRPLG